MISNMCYSLEGVIQQYPTLLQGNCSLPFLFSPNFERFIDADHVNKCLVIRETPLSEPGSSNDRYLDQGKILLSIPKEFINLDSGKLHKKQFLRKVASRVMFLDDNHTIRIITDKGFDCVFEIQSRFNDISRQN